VDYKQIQIDEVNETRAAFRKRVDELFIWSETHIDGPYWSDEERANFDPAKNGMVKAYLKCLASFDRQIQAIKDETPSTYITLGEGR
jgi:hypothetical protein